MDRAVWLAGLLLLSVPWPGAVAEGENDGSQNICVDAEGPSVETGNCGPAPAVGIVITIVTPEGTRQEQVGCRQDCDYTIDLCVIVPVANPSPIEGDFDVVELVDRKARELERMFGPLGERWIHSEGGPAPPDCMERMPGSRWL